jgi:hypothetical protein
MPVAISVNVTDTFEQWRLKTNQLGLDVFDAIRNIDEDITPSLGGDLNLTSTTGNAPGSYDIIGTGNINIDGSITCTGDIAGADIAGADITGSGDLSVTGGISGANFVVSSANGNVTGSNWSVDGATGELTLGAGITGGNWSVNDATSDITATTFSGDLLGTINTATTATTQSPGDNDVKVATTAYVDTGISSLTLTVDALSDTTIDANVQNQDLLMYDTNTSKWASGSIVAAGVPNQAFTVAMAIALGY